MSKIHGLASHSAYRVTPISVGGCATRRRHFLLLTHSLTCYSFVRSYTVLSSPLPPPFLTACLFCLPTIFLANCTIKHQLHSRIFSNYIAQSRLAVIDSRAERKRTLSCVQLRFAARRSCPDKWQGDAFAPSSPVCVLPVLRAGTEGRLNVPAHARCVNRTATGIVRS